MCVGAEQKGCFLGTSFKGKEVNGCVRSSLTVAERLGGMGVLRFCGFVQGGELGDVITALALYGPS